MDNPTGSPGLFDRPRGRNSVTVRLTSGERAALDRLAEAQGSTLQDVVLDAMRVFAETDHTKGRVPDQTRPFAKPALTKRISVIFSDFDLAWIDKVAADLSCTRSDVIVTALRLYFASAGEDTRERDHARNGGCG